MYCAMAYYHNEWGNYNIRAVRAKGYKTLEAAVAAVEKVGRDGYVRLLGQNQPAWSTS